VPTVTRRPRMHGRPPITAASCVIRSRTSMVRILYHTRHTVHAGAGSMTEPNGRTAGAPPCSGRDVRMSLTN
jgi:hypothetical protein